jgi:hypothetical protein
MVSNMGLIRYLRMVIPAFGDVKAGCNGRISTDILHGNPITRGNHLRPPNVDKISVRQVVQRMKDRSAAETTSVQAIYRQESITLAEHRGGSSFATFR